MPGPIPKREEERIRRNKPDFPITKVQGSGRVDIPLLGLEEPHEVVQDLWTSLMQSAQNQYYEQSDWAIAKTCLHLLDRQIKSARPSAQMLQTIFQQMNDLLLTEGARRKARMEIQRGKTDTADNVIDVTDVIRERLYSDVSG